MDRDGRGRDGSRRLVEISKGAERRVGDAGVARHGARRGGGPATEAAEAAAGAGGGHGVGEVGERGHDGAA